MQKYHVIIIGQGPAGLSSAIYTARAGLSTLVLGCEPKVAGDYEIDNYFGFPEAISGKDLIARGKKQAERFQAILRCERVLGVHAEEDDSFVVKTEQQHYQTQAVILATGVARIRPGIKNLSDYEGKGVSYCVSCDGFFYREKSVLVLGEGVFAANQALELLEYTPHVTLCTQGKPLAMGDLFLEKIQKDQIPIIEKKIVSLAGDNGLATVVFEDQSTRDVDGIFIAMGEASSLDFAYTLGVLRNGAFLQADHDQRTNVPGVFAAGDCVGRYLQISVAVGEGAVAARSAITHVKNIPSGHQPA